MKTQLPLPNDRKLTVVLRVEPGCLGPNGKESVEAFCNFSQQKLQSIDAGFLCWEIVPRHDKTLPEMQYLIASKKLSHEQAAKYLEAFDRNIGELEEALQENLAVFIDEFLGNNMTESTC